jgi:hypothetical protein
MGRSSRSPSDCGRMRTRRLFALWLALCALADAAFALRIEVLRGEGANNNASQNLGTTPVVRVLDAGGAAVPGALVVFTSPDSGATVEFAGQGRSAQALTDESGIAAAPHVRPIGNGPVEIRVMANLERDFANAVIHQMNLGAGNGPGRERELSLMRLPPAQAAAADPQAMALGIRVEDGTGRPVSSVAVLFVLRQDGKELWRTAIASNSTGEAFAGVPERYRQARLEFMVQAESEGRRVTDYFRLD